MLKKYNVLHITGKGNKLNVKEKGYYQVEFTNKIEDFFDASDLVICRGGANSLFELLALKKQMIIIPLSKAESRGDQLENADYFKKNNLAEVMLEENMSVELLINKIDDIFHRKLNVNTTSKYFGLTPNKKIVDIIKNAK